MSTRPALVSVALLVGTPFLTWGQQGAPAGLAMAESGFANKTFLIGEAGAERQPLNDTHSYFIFQPNGSAIYRGTRGTTVLKDSPLGWRIVGDSLCLIPSAFTIEAAGKTQRIEREAIKYAFAKVSGGYLLKRKGEQKLLTEVK
jgi:hypothetical protein